MMTVDREKLKRLQEREAKRFVAEHPRSAALYERAQHSLLGIPVESSVAEEHAVAKSNL